MPIADNVRQARFAVGEVDRIGLDFTEELEDGDSVTGATWAVLDSATAVTLSNASISSPWAYTWVTGVEAGATVHVVCTATTASSKTLPRKVTIRTAEAL